MATLLRMPEVAANATEAVLQDWSVAEGASYDAEDALATVETEKAVVDIAADVAGVVLKHLVPADSTVEVGAPIALLAAPGETVDDLEAVLASLGAAAGSLDAAVSAPERRAVPDDPEGGTADTGADRLPGLEVPSPRPVGPATGGNDARSEPRQGGRIFSSPLARRLAKEAGLPLEEIPGTGPRGRVTRRDVEARLGALGSRPTDVPSGQPRRRATPMRPVGEHTDLPHSRMRLAIATRLTESKQSTPHFYVRGTARVDSLLKLRAKLNKHADLKVSVNDLVVKAVARAHVLVPRVNVIWTDDAIRQFGSVDVAVAVATEDGLLTPVLRGVEQQSLSAVAAAARDIADRARSKRLRQDELEGGTVTVTNLGMYGTEEFSAIINPPHSAILAVGAAREEPVVKKGRVGVGRVLRVTLSVDHRAVDGTDAAEWMKVFLDLLENPVRILA